ncbi:hypothetical protein PVAND_003767 [Polypedilum vanderplanki]|uniref:Transcription factor Dp-1 n=1 Tax=Polypedilum vanderplanki TaxID=319348 RepID=A0A9J6BW33_POLVA|nr:hypothetical protein PVAND_003767 [Polypedilum vanderplanki]
MSSQRAYILSDGNGKKQLITSSGIRKDVHISQQQQILISNTSDRIHYQPNSSVASSRRSFPANSTPSNLSSLNKKNDKKRGEKQGKGLRHFSMRVCQKVKEKGVTTYNEVADELVLEECEDVNGSSSSNVQSYDQKNLRRRVYDALNVLMAMNIISKEKKEIRWIGLPTSSAQECEELEVQNQQTRKRIEEKQKQLRELVLKHVSLKSLIERNKNLEKQGIIPSATSAVQLPFIVINTNKKTHIDCNISNDKREYLLKFDDKFEVQDDIEVLKRMGLLLGMDKGESSASDIDKLKKMVPKAYQKYIEMYANGYLAASETHEETLDGEEDWTMVDQTQSSFSQEDSEELIAYEPEYVEEIEYGDGNSITENYS